MGMPTIYCSFCNKSQAEVKRIIAGPAAIAICDECVALCSDILVDEVSLAAKPNSSAKRTPHGIKAALDEYVIGQEHAKKTIAVAVHNHYKRLNTSCADTEISKSNILLIGPTGSGKTLLAETLARFLDVPLAIADATCLTQAGYVGDDVESILQRLLSKCDNDVEKAQKGIVYIDEIDKLAGRGAVSSVGRDVGGEGVQQALLKILEGCVCSVPVGGSRKPGQTTEKLQLDTRNILFICAGAFSGLERIISQRTHKSSIGFTGTVHSPVAHKPGDDRYQDLETQDLVTFGLIPEFIGRLPVIATLQELTEDGLISVLTQPKNALTRQYRKLLELEHVELEFTPDAVRAIAGKAISRRTGARGLRSIVENILLDTMFELPTREDVSKVIITENVVIAGAPPQIVSLERPSAVRVGIG